MLNREPFKELGSLPCRQFEYCDCEMGRFLTGQKSSFLYQSSFHLQNLGWRSNACPPPFCLSFIQLHLPSLSLCLTSVIPEHICKIPSLFTFKYPVETKTGRKMGFLTLFFFSQSLSLLPSSCCPFLLIS